MPPRLAVYIDYQNLYHGARHVFFDKASFDAIADNTDYNLRV